jgi:hypothetical protein
MRRPTETNINILLVLGDVLKKNALEKAKRTIAALVYRSTPHEAMTPEGRSTTMFTGTFSPPGVVAFSALPHLLPSITLKENVHCRTWPS